MYRFFIEESNIDTQEGKIRIVGDDVNHIRNIYLRQLLVAFFGDKAFAKAF